MRPFELYLPTRLIFGKNRQQCNKHRTFCSSPHVSSSSKKRIANMFVLF